MPLPLLWLVIRWAVPPPHEEDWQHPQRTEEETVEESQHELSAPGNLLWISHWILKFASFDFLVVTVLCVIELTLHVFHTVKDADMCVLSYVAAKWVRNAVVGCLPWEIHHSFSIISWLLIITAVKASRTHFECLQPNHLKVAPRSGTYYYYLFAYFIIDILEFSF